MNGQELTLDQDTENADPEQDYGAYQPIRTSVPVAANGQNGQLTQLTNANANHNGGGPIKCNLCGVIVRDRTMLHYHKNQCTATKNTQHLPVRRAGQSPFNMSNSKGHCCYHCDRIFPTKEELKHHVTELSKINQASEYWL